MKNKTTNAARTMAQARWAGTTPEERVAVAKLGGRPRRTTKRCFCGANTMLRAADRYFDCCRKAGVIVLNRRTASHDHEGA